MTVPAARPSGAPKPAAAWVADPSLVAGWARVQGVVVPERTGGRSVAEAVNTLVRAGLDPAVATSTCAEAGICPADLAALMAHLGWAHRNLRDALAFCISALMPLQRAFPGMDVRDAFGWLLVTDPAAQRPEEWPDEVIVPWQAVGPVEGGWRYAAAGFSPAEARAGLDAGTLTEEDVGALAALRGVPLPV